MILASNPGWHLVEKETGKHKIKKIPSLLYFIPQDPILTPKIAAFDLVNTLIWSNRGDYTVRGENNWVWRSPEIPKFLCSLLEYDFTAIGEPNNQWTIVIFSNYVSTGLDELQSRVEQMMRDLQESCGQGVEFFFFASLGNDEYKKPAIGMWQAFVEIWEKLTEEKLTPDPNSFFIGDRAGNPQAEDPMFRKGCVDVSPEELQQLGLPIETCLGDDSLFAARAGLHFLLPSELPPPSEPSFPLEGEQELIIMVGQQGSGKTWWVRRIVEAFGYSVIASDDIPTAPNDDIYIIKDKNRRLRRLQQLLAEGKSVIVDATHPTRASRADLIKIGHDYNVPVRIFWVSRPGRYYNEERIKPVPEVALRTYTKQFEEPSPEEGAEVVRLV